MHLPGADIRSRPRQAEMASFIFADKTGRYDGRDLETRPLGGTETSVIRCARELARWLKTRPEIAAVLHPAIAEAYAFRGMTLRESSDYNGARTHLQRAIALEPRLAPAYIDLGLVFLKTAQLDRQTRIGRRETCRTCGRAP